MSACSASSRFAALLAAALLTFIPAAALAKGKVTVTTDDGKTRRVEIDRHGITVTRITTDADSADSAWSSGGDIDVGPVVVRGTGSGIVRLFSDAQVEPGERVDGDVVAVFGSVRVEGEVHGAAVAVFCSVDLLPTARVHGDAVAVGGALREEKGARVDGQTVQVGFLPFTLGLPGLPMVLMSIVLAWLISLFFGWLSTMLFPRQFTRIAVTASRRTAASLALGIASGPLAFMTGLLLLVTVVGIPIAIFLPVVFFAVVYIGQLAATYVLGCKLTRRRLGEGNFLQPLLAGSLLVASVFGFGAILWETPGVVRTVALFFLLVGLLLMIGLSTIGAGAVLLSRAGTRPRDLEEPGVGPAPVAGDPSGAPVTP